MPGSGIARSLGKLASPRRGARDRAASRSSGGAKDTLATKRDLDLLRMEIAKLGGELHAEIHRAVSGSTRQMYMALLGHMAMTLGFIYFLNTQLR